MMSFLSFVRASGARSFLKRYKEIELLFQFDKDNKDWANAAESAELRQLYRDAFKYLVNAKNYEKALELGLKYYLRPRLFIVNLRVYLDPREEQAKIFKSGTFKKEYEVFSW
jgi:hypothetical protein